MNKSKFSFILRLVGSLIAVVLLVRLVAQLGLAGVVDALRELDVWRFALALVLVTVSRLAVSLRWHVLLRVAGVDIPVTQSVRITFAGFFAANFLPSTIGGDVVRLGMVLQRGHDKVVAAASLIVDRLVGMSGMGSALVFGVQPVLGMAAIPGDAPLGTGAFAFFATLRARMGGVATRLGDALKLWGRHPKGLLLAFGLTWVHQLSIYSIHAIFLDGLGEPVSFWLLAGVWSFVYFVTLLPISINGLGLQEVSMVGFYTLFLGVSETSAVTVAVLFRALQMLASVPGAVFLPDILARLGKAKKAEEGDDD